MNAGRNALPAAMLSMPHSRISFTSRSCSVPLARSTRPLACEELAQNDVDVQRMQSPAELGHAVTADRILLVDPEHTVLVGIERHWLAVKFQIGGSRLIFGTTSTSSGTGCRQGAIFLRRYCGSIFRRQMVGRDRWGFQLSPTALPRRSP